MQFRPVSIALAELPCVTRVPFRFGSVTLEAAPLLHAQVRLEAVDGRTATGMAADLLVPKWFRKDPTRSGEQDQADLRAAVRDAARLLLDRATPGRVFDLWWDVYDHQVRSQDEDAPDLLVRGFGCALLERAMIDAACRLTNKSFWSALHSDLLGVDLARMHGELYGLGVTDLLPERPRTRFDLRHTVGMLDPLRDADVETPLDDGLPQSLFGYLRDDGVRWLKIKIGGGHDRDVQRLAAIASLCRDLDLSPGITLDGNEQFDDLGAVADVLDAARATADGERLLSRLALVEQPLPRAATFDAKANAGLPRVAAHAPLVLDEADTSLLSFPRALGLGWRGCSVKNCKGVFRALANRGLCVRRGGGAFQSGEDLTNLPLLPLQQDLTTMSVLDLAHVERNGHHYFRGLEHLPEPVVAAALRAHGDLYRPRDGGAELSVQDGELRTDSLLGPGYGCDAEPFAALADALAWTVLE